MFHKLAVLHSKNVHDSFSAVCGVAFLVAVHDDVVSFGDDAFEVHMEAGVGFEVGGGEGDDAVGSVAGVGVVLAVAEADVLCRGLGGFFLVEDQIKAVFG